MLPRRTSLVMCLAVAALATLPARTQETPRKPQSKAGKLQAPAAPPPVQAYSSRPLEIPLERIGPPVFSADGGTLAFSSLDQEERSHIHVMPLDGAPRAITSGPFNDVSPSFSPDGRQIAFVSNRSGNDEIWTIPVSGGEPKKITDDAARDRDPAWSHDGASIVFASNRSGATLLYVVPAQGGQVFPITSGIGPHRRPAWSPDGDWIAYESWEHGKPSVWLIPAAGGEPKRLGAREGPLRGPTWAAAPGQLHCFGILRKNLVVITYSLNGALIRRSTLPVQWSEGSPVPALSRGRDRLVYLNAGGSGLGFLDFRTGGPFRSLTEGGSINRDPTWSMDNQRLIFASDRGGGVDIHSSGLRSGRSIPLTDNETRESGLGCSPVNGDIVLSRPGPGGSEIWILEPETGRSIEVSASPGRNLDPAWSRDGKRVAFASDREGSLDIWVAQVGDMAVRKLTSLPGSERQPTWSSDGAWVAFSVEDQGRSWIARIPAAGGDVERVASLPPPGRAVDPDWRPGGDWIVFTGEEGSGSLLYIVPSKGGEPFPMLQKEGTRISQAVWSHDGNLIGYAWAKRDTVMLMELGKE